MKELKFDSVVKKLRTEKGWSQQKLAEKAEVAYNVITRIEQGLTKEPTIQTIMKIAEALDISIDELVEKGKQ